MSVAEATAIREAGLLPESLAESSKGAGGLAQFVSEDVDHFDGLVDEHLPGRIVREKLHPGEPMTVDDALQNMELVGHDFYLFHDKESGKPSVVYRRRAYDYGILRLDM